MKTIYLQIKCMIHKLTYLTKYLTGLPIWITGVQFTRPNKLLLLFMETSRLHKNINIFKGLYTDRDVTSWQEHIINRSHEFNGLSTINPNTNLITCYTDWLVYDLNYFKFTMILLTSSHIRVEATDHFKIVTSTGISLKLGGNFWFIFFDFFVVFLFWT